MLKLNNHILKKVKNLDSLHKNDAKMSGFEVLKNVPNHWKNFFFEKKKLSNLFVQIRFWKWCTEIFLKQMGLEIFKSWWFYGSKSCSAQ